MLIIFKKVFFIANTLDITLNLHSEQEKTHERIEDGSKVIRI